MSEMNRVYLSHIDYEEDIKNILRYGVPRETRIPPMGHDFFMWDTEMLNNYPSGGYFALNLKGK